MSTSSSHNRFQLKQIYHKYLLIEIFSYLSLEHTLLKLFEADHFSRGFLIRNFSFIQKLLKKHQTKQITLSQLIKLESFQGDKEAFSKFDLLIETYQELSIFHKIHKAYLKKGYLLDKLKLIDIIPKNNQEVRQFLLMLKEITPNILSIVQQRKLQSHISLQIPLRQLHLQAHDINFLEKIEDLKSLQVQQIYLNFNNNKSIYKHLSQLLLNKQIQEVQIHKLNAQSIINLFNKVGPLPDSEVFQKLKLRKIEIKQPGSIQKVNLLMTKYGFQITKLHIHEMGLQLDEQFQFFQLINNIEILHLDQITIKEFDKSLIEKVINLPDPKVRQIDYNYFYLYDLDPFQALLSIKYSRYLQKTSFSFQNSQEGVFTNLIHDFLPYTKMIDFRQLQEVVIYNCTDRILDWFESVTQKLQVRKLTVSETLTTEKLADLFSVQHLKHIVILNSLMDKDRLKTYQQNVIFTKKFVNLTRLEFSEYEIWYQQWKALEFGCDEVKEVKHVGRFVEIETESFKETMLWVFRKFQKMNMTEMEITDRRQFAMLKQLEFCEIMDDKHYLRCDLFGQNLLSITKSRIRDVNN